MSGKKLKILLMGPVDGQMDVLTNKLKSLQQSKAGPFDVCFCVGPFGSSVAAMPLPVYVQQYSGSPTRTEAKEETDNGDEKTPPTQLAENLFFLGNPDKPASDIYSIEVGEERSKKSLVVATCPFANVSSASKEEMQPLLDKVNHVSYVGCDFLLTQEWPQGIHSVLPAATEESSNTSFDVADIALKARARYHVSVGNHHNNATSNDDDSAIFCQSLPFSHLTSSTSTTSKIQHCGRFLALAPVKTPQEFQKLDKKKHKFVHALGLIPLFEMTMEEIEQDSSKQRLEPCPYTDASYEKDGAPSDILVEDETNIGFSEARARRIMAEEASNTEDYRWKGKNRAPRNQTDDDKMDHSASSTLFCHGLHKDVSGHLQTGSVALLQAFHKFGIAKVRRPPAHASYAFLEFNSHDDARNCLESLGGEITVHGVHLTLKWATTAPTPSGSQGNAGKKRRMTEAEAPDSCTLYFRLPPKVLTNELESATEDLRILMQETLEMALAGDDGDEKVTAETEPALQVKARRAEEKNFGFLEFASHVAASMALATLTGNTDGGVLMQAEPVQELLSTRNHLLGVMLHWALDAPSDNKRQKTGGLSFERRHFPPDSRTDCWFCLASPTCERHLIVSVHDECYIAMPKGPVHEGHVLIVPVAHTSRGVFCGSVGVAQEVESLQSQLAQHAAHAYDSDLFIFERAIQTRGGYHTHVQCVPISHGTGPKIVSTMLKLAQAIPGFELKEINTELPLSAILTQDDDDDENNSGYFYAEVQSIKDGTRKRYLYKKPPNDEDNNANSMKKASHSNVPLQFAREVIATVLENPDLAHWKACVKKEEEETEMTAAFRKSFGTDNE